PKRKPRRRGPEVIQPQTKGAYNSNDAIKSHIHGVEVFKKDPKWAKSMRDLGFGSVLAFHPDGLSRGTSVFVSLSDETENKAVLKGKAASHYSFNKGTSTMNYPSSIMGYVALLRQTHMDAEWYAESGNKSFYDESLEAWNSQQDLPQIFDTRGKLNFMRADKLGDEFNKQFIIKGSGDEYQNLDWIKTSNAPIILPLNFPKAYDVSDAYDAMQVSLAQMKHWELAPTNPSALFKAGMTVALTTDGLRNKKEFMSNLKKAIKYGLGEEDAMKALTITPAQLLKVDDRLGSLEEGKLANFVVASGSPFANGTKIYQNWIQGKKYEVNPMPQDEISGNYELKIDDQRYKLSIMGSPDKPKFKVMLNDSIELKSSGSYKDDWISLSFSTDKSNKATIQLSGMKSGKNLKGEGSLGDGSWTSWEATYTSDTKAGKKKPEKKMEKVMDIGEVIYPFVSYGSTTLAETEEILFKNATVWTNESQGIVEGMDVLVKDGKIAKVGKNLKARKAREVDATGKHLSPGVIDEHSHIALSGVNDVATVSAMVRMKDAVDHESINMYRQLSGGVVAAQLLHGSANPIGGQSALVKFRWGQTPDRLLIAGADEYIKFALGENVKRSRSSNSIRYPQTRMGVEQVYMDAFTRAVEYGDAWNKYAKEGGVKPRRDLALEALLEIVNKDRFITCHSYIQSEITMLMRMAEKFGFRVNTFTHILEGYKVADKMAKHGAGGSTFADWWAYKFEVYEAIPHNPSLMTEQGVTVAVNSDNAEMARRLNQEAAKAVKYGGMSEEEALKMVTLNPAKLLHLDKRMGSIKVGKDADIVLWTDNPLSIYAKAEMTLVDGKVMYSMKKDAELRQAIQAERTRLIQKMKAEKKAGGKMQRPYGRPRHSWHCDEILDYQLEASHGH
ncbi:MAG: amidohydrolase family protein, partial [Bacteroidia bacterium]|nr:amidohydrolase family protein [Bacteroidia bacterium]